MGRTGRAVLCGGAVSAIALGGTSLGAETVVYTYDALGRLITSAATGGSNDGVATAICMDAAGNRTVYVTAKPGVASCGTTSSAPAPTPTPTPTPPPPPNDPPVANGDATTVVCYMSKVVNVVSNDTDPNGNYPLSLTSVSGGGDTTASVISGTSIEIQAGYRGSTTFTYTVQDSLGATATGSLYVTVNGTFNQCDA